MNKRNISYVILGISIFVLIYLAFFFQRTTKFSKYVVDEVQYQTIVKTRTETADELILRMTFNEYEAVYDSLDGCFYYSLIEEHEERYDPQVGFEGRDKNVKLAIRDIEITDEMIAENVEIELLAYDDTFYKRYQIRCTTLPIASIYFYEEPMETDVDIAFQLFDNRAGAVQRELTSDGKMRIRGVTTAGYEKKGYKVTLIKEVVGNNVKENKLSVLGMRQDGDWMLYAGYNDQEKIRNVFSANLWYASCAANNVFGIDNGMEYRYAETFFNGHYRGLYAIGYPIDEQQLELLQASKADDISEFMLKKMTWVQEIETDSDYSRLLESYEFQWSEEGTFTPENREQAIEYHRMLDEAGVEDAEKLYEMVDIGNSIDVYLFYNLIQGVDNAHEGDTKNLYLTYKSDGEKGKFLITPWDFDLAWGNEYHWNAAYATAQYTFGEETPLIMDKNAVHLLLENGDEEIKALIASRYQELREGSWSEDNLMQMLDEYEKQIFDSGAYAREYERWPHANYVAKEQKLSQFKEYVKERLLVMDEYVADITY